MKKFFTALAALTILASCDKLKYEYNITQISGTGNNFEYYTNSYVIDGPCVKFVDRSNTDTTIVCGSYSIKKNQEHSSKNQEDGRTTR